MPEDYPPEWGFMPDREPPVEHNGRRLDSLKSGCPDPADQRGEPTYPDEWRH